MQRAAALRGRVKRRYAAGDGAADRRAGPDVGGALCLDLRISGFEDLRIYLRKPLCPPDPQILRSSDPHIFKFFSSF
jgi:hypothetical protein